MKAEYEINQITCRTLHGILRDKIKGGINCRVSDEGTLVVKIYTDSFEFEYSKEKWLDYVNSLQYDINVIANEIIAIYKSFIIKKFFYY